MSELENNCGMYGQGTLGLIKERLNSFLEESCILIANYLDIKEKQYNFTMRTKFYGTIIIASRYGLKKPNDEDINQV